LHILHTVMAKLKLTDELGKQIIELIESGNTMEDAATLNDVSASSLYSWLRQGEKAAQRIIQGESEERKLLRRFYEAVQRAKVVPKVNVVNSLYFNATVKKDQRSIEFWLSNKYPKEYGKQQTLNLGNVGDKPLQVTQHAFDLSKMNDRQLEAYEKYLETLAEPAHDSHSESTDQTDDESDSGD